jgi:hypothetical protein
MTLQERTLYICRVQYRGPKMMRLQWQLEQQNTRVVFVEWGLGHYRLDPLFAHLHHQHHACPKKLHSIIE